MLIIFVDGETAPTPAPGFRRLRFDLCWAQCWCFGNEVGGGVAVISTRGDDAGFFVLRSYSLYAE
jgi:hypothetical protein